MSWTPPSTDRLVAATPGDAGSLALAGPAALPATPLTVPAVTAPAAPSWSPPSTDRLVHRAPSALPLAAPPAARGVAMPTTDEQQTPGWLQSVAPNYMAAADQAVGNPKASIWSEPLAALSDVLSLGTRALGQVRTNPETNQKYQMSDPQSALFRPETQRAQAAVAPAWQKNPGAPPPENALQETLQRAPGAIADIVGTSLSDPTTLFGIGAAALKKGLTPLLTKIAGEVTGVPEEALTQASTIVGRRAMVKNAGQEGSIGASLADDIHNADQTMGLAADRAKMDNALANMPPVDMMPTMQALEGAKVANATAPNAIAANKEIDKFISNLLEGVDPSAGTMPAADAHGIRTQLDNWIASAFNRDDWKYKEIAGGAARTQLENDLRAAALQSGNQGYIEAANDMADKLHTLALTKQVVGHTEGQRILNMQSVIDNLYGKNKSAAQATLADFGGYTGNDYLGDIRAAQNAQSIGMKEGKLEPSWLPVQTTGRSIMGPLLEGGLATHAVMAPNPATLAEALLGASTFSPRIVSGIAPTGALLPTGLLPALNFASALPTELAPGLFITGGAAQALGASANSLAAQEPKYQQALARAKAKAGQE